MMAPGSHVAPTGASRRTLDVDRLAADTLGSADLPRTTGIFACRLHPWRKVEQCCHVRMPIEHGVETDDHVVVPLPASDAGNERPAA